MFCSTGAKIKVRLKNGWGVTSRIQFATWPRVTHQLRENLSSRKTDSGLLYRRKELSVKLKRRRLSRTIGDRIARMCVKQSRGSIWSGMLMWDNRMYWYHRRGIRYLCTLCAGAGSNFGSGQIHPPDEDWFIHTMEPQRSITMRLGTLI